MVNHNIDYSITIDKLTVGQLVELLKAQPKPTTTEQKELLTIYEASEFLHLSIPTLYSMNCRNQIPFTKVSGKVYYRRTALEQWLESGERKTKAQLRREVEEGK
jgi:excisionase family DNA binding protein